jgi:hypothetical protein
MRIDVGGKIEREGRDVLAIPVGVSRNEFVLTKLAELRKLPARIVRDGEVEQWRFEGVFRHEGRLYLHGAYLDGQFLEEVVGKPFAAALPFLVRLVRTLSTLNSHGLMPQFIQTDSVYFLEDGGILFLPEALMKELRSMHPEAYKLQVFEAINHPDMENVERSLSFSVASLLHRIALGAYPFQADSEEEMHNRIRHARLLPLSLIEPGFREDLSRQILAGLGRGEAPAPAIGEWQDILAACGRQGLYRDISESEKEQLRKRAGRERRRTGKAYQRRVFWQKHWKTVLITAAAVVLVSGLAASLLKNILAPRQTAGYTPRQVVESYYQGINELDHALMEDCVVDGAGKQTIREVTNIYVLSRVSLGYEGRSHIVPADVWEAEGRPELPAPQTVYGITDLELTQEQGQPEPVFLASYTKWAPEPGQEASADRGSPDYPETAGPSFSSRRIRERVYLRMDRKDWVIYKFERL